MTRDLNILLVEDDDLDTIIVKRALASAGSTSRLFVARDGTEALAMLRDGSIPSHRRVVLTDLAMPRMTGLELVRAIRADPELCSLSVVVLTTSDEERERIDAYQLNVAGYILKPVTFQAFIDALAMLEQYWNQMEL